ncbi:unnamed protein product [Orchesella dallaii]|uniref:PIN domain-containing protein n=1 Tax=Orchesella dallaii TaxID=48710 RepID=A0ABP1RPB0_9HEXA
MDGMKLLVSGWTLIIFRNYVYAELLKGFKKDQRIAFVLLEAAHFYNVEGLERIMKRKLMALLDFPGEMGADLAIMLYFFASRVELSTTRSEIEKSEAFQYIITNDKTFGELVRTSGISENASSTEE